MASQARETWWSAVLGVSLEGGVVRFDKAAPPAPVRRQIVMGNPARPQRRVPMP